MQKFFKKHSIIEMRADSLNIWKESKRTTIENKFYDIQF